jgi:hypothetical protein
MDKRFVTKRAAKAKKVSFAIIVVVLVLQPMAPKVWIWSGSGSGLHLVKDEPSRLKRYVRYCIVAKAWQAAEDRSIKVWTWGYLMIIRTILVQPKPDIEEKLVTDTLARFHTLREECSGIFDILVAKSSHPDYSYGVVIRYTRPPFVGGLFHQHYYQAIVDDVEQIAQIVLVFDVGGEKDQTAYLDETEYHPAEQMEGTFAYGNFQPTVEERLRRLVRLWTRGNGQALAEATKLTEDTEDAFGLDLVQLDDAMKAEFGVSFLESGLIEFGDLVRYIEQHIRSRKK